eukprot:9074707-Pyramimonas_sp.AAC.1
MSGDPDRRRPTLDRIAVAKSATKSPKIAQNRTKSHAIFRDFADDPVEGRPQKAVRAAGSHGTWKTLGAT